MKFKLSKESVKQLRGIVSNEANDFVQEQAEEVISFESNPMEYILNKYPSLTDTLSDLLTDYFRDYVTGVFVVAPKPTTFKVLLHNGQMFFLTYGPKSWIAKVAGKRYYLLNLNEEESAIEAIARLLELGRPPGAQGPDEATSGESVNKEEAPTEEEGGEEAAAGGEEEAGMTESKQPKMKIKLIKENSLLTEVSNEYDDLIKAQFKGKIPKPTTKVKIGKDFQLSGEDLKVWQKLFPITPPAASGEATKGSGNGEIAAYWLFQNNGYDVIDGRGGESPDLIFLKGPGVSGKTGVEIKSYGKAKIDLGKYSKDKQSLYLLNTIFGFDTLLSALRKEAGKEYNPANFSSKDLESAAQVVIDLDKNKELRNVAKKYNLDILTTLFERLDIFKKNLSLTDKYTASDVAARLLSKLVSTKLSNKPGNGGYVLDCLKDGSGTFYKIDLDKLKKLDPEVVKDSVSTSQAQIQVNFGNLFK